MSAATRTSSATRRYPLGAAPGARFALLLAALALFSVLMYIALTYHIWPMTGTLSVLLVLSAAWLFGSRGGILMACLSPLLNVLFLGLVGPVDWGLELIVRGVQGTTALLAIGLAVGWLRSATEALGTSEARLRAQYRAFPLPTYTWQHERGSFTLTDFNDALAADTRGGIAALRGIRHHDLYRHQPEIAATIEACHASGTTVRQQLRHRLIEADEERDFIFTYVPIPPNLVLLHLEDITERLHTETALRASEENLAAAQRIAHLGSWEYLPATRALHWSDEMFRIAGHLLQAFVPNSQQLLAAIHPDDRERAHYAMTTAHQHGEPYDVEYRFVRPDAPSATYASRPRSSTTTPIGQPAGAAACST